MSDESGPVEREVARFYTRSRKFPRMVGRLPEGTRIWGGPYTFTQLGLGLVAIFVALATRAVWSWGSVLIDLAVVMGVGWGVAYVGRFIPMTNLNPLVVVSTALGAFAAPVAGTYRGRSVVVARPHVVRGRTVVETARAGDAPGRPVAREPVGREPVARDPVGRGPAGRAAGARSDDSIGRARAARGASRGLARDDVSDARPARAVAADASRRPVTPVPDVDAGRHPDPMRARTRDAAGRPGPVPEHAAPARSASAASGPPPGPDDGPARRPAGGRAVTGLDRLLAQAGPTRTPSGR